MYNIFKMKKLIVVFVFFISFLGCQKEQLRNTNPYIPNYSFSISIDTGLPLYSGLKTPINPIYIGDTNVGVKGIIVMKISETEYKAWEATCPNQYPSDCTTLVIKGNTEAKCNCDNIVYSLFTGVGTGQYTMKPYRVDILENGIVRIYN